MIATAETPLWAFLVAALVPGIIGAVGTLTAVILSNRKTRRENNDQHGVSVEKLSELTGEVRGLTSHVERMDEKFDDVIERVAVIEANSGDTRTGGAHHLELIVEPMHRPDPPR